MTGEEIVISMLKQYALTISSEKKVSFGKQYEDYANS